MKAIGSLLLIPAPLTPLAQPALAQDTPALSDEELIASAEQGAPESLGKMAQVTV